MKKRTSLKDIAQKVGVSTALVSYVLNNRMEGRIRKEMVEKIRKAAVSLNYQTNQVAKSLKTNKTNTIGLIVADISNPFSSGLARIIEDEAYRHGYTVIFGSSDETNEKCALLVDTFLNRQVDGLVILPPENSDKLIKSLHTRKIPFVLVDRYFPELAVNGVCLDNYEASRELVGKLLEQGKKRIGMISYDTSLVHLTERERGYRAALKEADIKINKQWVKRIAMSQEEKEVSPAVASLLSLDQPVDAILFISNTTVLLGLQHINTLPVKQVKDLSIASFDKTDVFDFLRMPVSYVQQPLQEMGIAALELLLKNISKYQKSAQLFMKGKLVVR
ncbi:MAG: LacI family transcriptional regulator [Citrobacter freundii]|nr:MAG: LacI family transcriptional regulator [Citrobacter freundii]